VPAPALGVNGTVRAGVLYTRTNYWPTARPATMVPHLDIDLGLNLHGVVVSREVVSYDLGVGWTRTSDQVPGGARTDYLTYAGAATLLQNEVSPVGLSVFANRGETEFATSDSPDAFGRGIATSMGGTVSLKGKLPRLDTSYSWHDAQTHIPGQPLRDTTAHLVSSSLQLVSPAVSVTGSYTGELRDGNWSADRVQIHGATLDATGRIGNQTVSFTAGSALTEPGELLPGTFRQQTTTFMAGLNAQGTTTLRRMVFYQYGHTLTEAPGAPTQEIERQSVRYEGDHFLTRKELFTRWFIDGSYAATSSDETELVTTGETLGTTLFWRPALSTYTFEVNAGPRVALLQTETEESGGLGATAGARASRPVGIHALQLDWSGAYGQNLFATVGWNFHQTLGATLSGPAATARYSATLRATSTRTHSPVTGDGAGRSLAANATLRMRLGSLYARARLTEGIVGATPERFSSDGLILPAPFNSKEIDAAIGGQARIYPGLSAKLDVHLGRSDIPNRPVLHELAATAGLTYRYAAFGMGVENRISRVETVGGWDTANLVMVRVFRSLSW
jgi:hypothetical protein